MELWSTPVGAAEIELARSPGIVRIEAFIAEKDFGEKVGAEAGEG